MDTADANRRPYLVRWFSMSHAPQSRHKTQKEKAWLAPRGFAEKRRRTDGPVTRTLISEPSAVEKPGLVGPRSSLQRRLGAGKSAPALRVSLV